MERTAESGAARGQAALARTAAAFHDHLGGTLPLVLGERVNAQAAPAEGRTVMPLRREAEAC